MTQVVTTQPTLDAIRAALNAWATTRRYETFGVPDFVARESVSGGQQRFMFRCGECRKVWARDYERTERWTYGLWKNGFPFASLSSTEYVRQEAGTDFYHSDRHENLCICGRVTRDRYTVVGKMDPDAPCNDSCREAVGPTCRCICGGARHGEKWLVKEMV